MNNTIKMAVLMGLLLSANVSSRGEENQTQPAQNWLTTMAADSAKKDAAAAASTKPADPAKEWTKPIPINFNISYVMASDYVFRGINFSEYPREGREKINNQMTVGIEYDTGKFGTFGGIFWFEWFAGQEKLTPDYGGTNQETDYTVYWKYAIADLATTFETGWIAYTFPPFAGDGDAFTTYEWYVKLSFDDSVLWKTPKPVLNPYIAYYQDLDLASGTSWWELGVSHGFAMSDYFKDAPILKDLTITPSLVMGVSDRYYKEIGLGGSASTSLANLNYGLDISYDLSSALKLPPQAGKLAVGGFLNYSQALCNVIKDELYGGLKVSYSW